MGLKQLRNVDIDLLTRLRTTWDLLDLLVLLHHPLRSGEVEVHHVLLVGHQLLDNLHQVLHTLLKLQQTLLDSKEPLEAGRLRLELYLLEQHVQGGPLYLQVSPGSRKLNFQLGFKCLVISNNYYL